MAKKKNHFELNGKLQTDDIFNRNLMPYFIDTL